MFTKTHAAFVVAILLASPLFASAHERQLFTIGSAEYLFVVGSLAEPIVVDDKTGIDLRVKLADPKDPTNSSAAGAIPVEGLESVLKVELIAGDKKKTMDISPAYKDPGAYKNTFFPTVKTSYTYRFTGIINNTPIDLSFTCAPEGNKATEDKSVVVISTGVTRTYKNGQFGCPMGKEELGFPEETMTALGLHQDAEHHMNDVLLKMEEGAAQNQSGAALAFGLIGTILGGIAFVKSRTPKL